MDYNPFSLNGKTVLVTGASSGIGKDVAAKCSQMGARVVLIARNEERLQETYNDMEGEGHIICPYDLTKTDGIKQLVSQIVEESGEISGIVNCAGISNVMPLKFMTPTMMDEFFKTNVYAPMELTKHVLSAQNVNKNGASVIFISSVMGCVGENAKSLYSMTKGALISGCRSLAVEYSKRKIRVNCISPGVVVTPINQNQPYIANPEKRAVLESKHLLGLGMTSDIAYACVYLLSDASRWITGQNLIVDGGYTVL